jgi:hypothetical protein
MISKTEEHIQFLEENLIKNLRIVIDKDLIVFSFVLMAQGIEIMGAYLDTKPMRAVRQSAARFNIALSRLFPKGYSDINKKGFLYKQLRSNIIHMYIPTSSIELRRGVSISGIHMQKKNDVLILYLEDFYEDYLKAINKLIYLIKSNKLKLKKISGSIKQAKLLGE